MFNHIEIKIFGTNEDEKEIIENQFAWKDILASDNNFVINCYNDSVYDFYEDGNLIASISFAGNHISIHPGRYESNKKICERLEKAIAAYFDCHCLLATDFRNRPYQLEIFKPNFTEHYGIKIGDHILFGQYQQGKDGESLPISWRVLNIDGENAFLISDKCLIRSGYCNPREVHDKPWYLMWEFSLTREICNGDFYYQAFSDDERDFIIPKQIASDNISETNSDFVFIPSENEVKLFLPDKADKQASPTDYLMNSEGKPGNVFLGYDKENEFTSWWLLPEYEENMIYYPKAVWPNGAIQFHGRNIHHDDFTIRPCIMVKLSESFGKFVRYKNVQPNKTEKVSELFDENKISQQAKPSGDKPYSLKYIQRYQNIHTESYPGARSSTYDRGINKWRMRIQLDESGQWFLSVFRNANGDFYTFSLDDESADDSHYEFLNGKGVRKKLCTVWNGNKHLAEIMIDYLKKHNGTDLLRQIYPFVTNEFHY